MEVACQLDELDRSEAHQLDIRLVDASWGRRNEKHTSKSCWFSACGKGCVVAAALCGKPGLSMSTHLSPGNTTATHLLVCC